MLNTQNNLRRETPTKDAMVLSMGMTGTRISNVHLVID